MINTIKNFIYYLAWKIKKEQDDPRVTNPPYSKTSKIVYCRCSACNSPIGYPPILIPIDKPKPAQHSPGTFIYNRVPVCHLCVHKITAPGGEFDQLLDTNEFLPDALWTIEEDIVSIKPYNEQSLSKLYRKGSEKL